VSVLDSDNGRNALYAMDDFNPEDFFSDFDSLPDVFAPARNSMITNQRGQGIFNNCHMSGVTINFNFVQK
jgi:hypothetical protein